MNANRDNVFSNLTSESLDSALVRANDGDIYYIVLFLKTMYTDTSTLHARRTRSHSNLSLAPAPHSIVLILIQIRLEQ